MRIRGFLRIVTSLAVLMVGVSAFPDRLSAHCDSMDGPVIQAAMRALAANAVELALVWVRPDGEDEIRDAFRRTMKVRAAGGEAQDLADRWFFETLVRVHRMGEGEPYTGLKPAGSDVSEGIVQAERALEAGSVEELAGGISHRTADVLREKFAHVEDLSRYHAADVEAGRAYVRAYTEYVHFVEALHAMLTGDAGPH